MTEVDAIKCKEEFCRIFRENIKRDGAEELLRYLDRSDFFTAPASTRYHLACEGGLVQHSLNVYKELVTLCEMAKANYKGWDESVANPESIAICSLLHDLCKVNVYKTEMRNRKNEMGQWEQYQAYTYEENLPYGHGEKSVYIASGFMKLTREEAMAIRFHMGAWKEKDIPDASIAFEKYPFAMMVHFADMVASKIDEAGE